MNFLSYLTYQKEQLRGILSILCRQMNSFKKLLPYFIIFCTSSSSENSHIFLNHNSPIEQLISMCRIRHDICSNFSSVLFFFELMLSILNTNEHGFYFATTPHQQQQHEKDNSEKITSLYHLVNYVTL